MPFLAGRALNDADKVKTGLSKVLIRDKISSVSTLHYWYKLNTEKHYQRQF